LSAAEGSTPVRVRRNEPTSTELRGVDDLLEGGTRALLLRDVRWFSLEESEEARSVAARDSDGLVGADEDDDSDGLAGADDEDEDDCWRDDGVRWRDECDDDFAGDDDDERWLDGRGREPWGVSFAEEEGVVVVVAVEVGAAPFRDVAGGSAPVKSGSLTGAASVEYLASVYFDSEVLRGVFLEPPKRAFIGDEGGGEGEEKGRKSRSRKRPPG
jgi:hypothetical protein